MLKLRKHALSSAVYADWYVSKSLYSHTDQHTPWWWPIKAETCRCASCKWMYVHSVGILFTDHSSVSLWKKLPMQYGDQLSKHAQEKPGAVRIKLQKWSGLDIHWGRIPVPQRSKLWVGQEQCKTGTLRGWRRTTEGEAETVGRTWRQVKAIVGNQVNWHCFVEALCSELEYQELTCCFGRKWCRWLNNLSPTGSYMHFVTMITMKIYTLTSLLQCCSYEERNLLEIESMHGTAKLSVLPNFAS